MLSNLAKRFFSTPNERTIKSYQKIVDKVNELEKKYSILSDDDLKNNTLLFKESLTAGKSLDELLPDSFAVVREAAKRTLGQRHYDVQIIGGIALHQGKISEMKTGEGKTMVSTLAAYLNALSNQGVHIVTVNDYLAKRDSEWMGSVYKFLGLSVDCIYADMGDSDRKIAYNSDITYGTNNEFGFDYLRDNMKFDIESLTQRPFNFAIIDEVDSILIDEARTPLIISGATEDNSNLYKLIDGTIKYLKNEDFEREEKSRSINLTELGIEHMEKILKDMNLLKNGSLYSVDNIALLHHTNQALKAHKVFIRDNDYIVQDDQIIIIDEFTGRMMEGRRYSEGLHQAIEAKENVKINNENQTLASITFQNYFRMYPKLSGMTGTANTEAAEFSEIYSLEVLEIPTHQKMVRIDSNDEIYRTKEEKWKALIKNIELKHKIGQPILVGTTNIETSEFLSKKLKKIKIKHQILNARHHEKEAEIIAQAGKPYALTIATNMAGRGTDIQLGGNILNINIQESGSIEKQKKVKDKGGLYVIGTERHESRRIDNQLRGRSGRQGDPGETKFYLSLEDDLMRIFGSERLDAMLVRLGLKEGESIHHPWISKALEKAQQKVEGRNFEIRKNLLRFDDVMNDQRKVIYDQRLELITAKNINQIILDMRNETIDNLIEKHIPPKTDAELWNVKDLSAEFKGLSGLDLPINEWIKKEEITTEIIKEKLSEKIDSIMKDKKNIVGENNLEIIGRQILIQILDQHWKDHLLSLDHLRQGIGLRAYAQKDPLNEYKREAFNMFENMLYSVRESVTNFMLKVTFDVPKDEPIKKKVVINRTASKRFRKKKNI